jgi:hypothetical protein
VIHLFQTSNPIRADGDGVAVDGHDPRPEPPTAQTSPAVGQDSARPHHREKGDPR